MRTLSAEFAKIFTTRMWWILLLVMVVYVGALAAGGAWFAGWQSGEGAPIETLPFSVPLLIYTLTTSVGYVFPILLGALAATSEFRHQTLNPTFLATPRRWKSLAAKAFALLVLGAGYGAVGLLATAGLGGGILALYGIDAGLGDAETWATLGRAVAAMALWAVIGVGLGVLVPSPVGAIVIVLGFTQFLEPILRTAAGFLDWTREIGRFLPGAAGDALVGTSFFELVGGSTADALEWWQGGLVLLALAAIITFAGYFVSWRRDVT